PVLDVSAGHRYAAGHSGLEEIAARCRHSPFALLRGHRAAPRANDLTGAPTAGLVVLRGFGADRISLGVPVDGFPAAVLLGIAVPGEYLDQGLLLGVVVWRGELLVQGGARGRIEAPRRAVRDDDGLEAPLRQFFEQHLGGECALVTVKRQL